MDDARAKAFEMIRKAADSDSAKNSADEIIDPDILAALRATRPFGVDHEGFVTVLIGTEWKSGLLGGGEP